MLRLFTSQDLQIILQQGVILCQMKCQCGKKTESRVNEANSRLAIRDMREKKKSVAGAVLWNPSRGQWPHRKNNMEKGFLTPHFPASGLNI